MNIEVIQDGVKYTADTQAPIKKGDKIRINNPHPESAIKDYIKTCDLIIQHEDEPHYLFYDQEARRYSHMYPKHMVSKIINEEKL